MNFLAHLYLSGLSEKIMVGNFIGDYVKGKEYKKYPEEIQYGILLHRKIDDFTDHSLIFKESRNHFTSRHHKYAGVITDVIYDHFLSMQWNSFSAISFEEFVYISYENLINNFDYLPENVQHFLPYFVVSNWLDSYRTFEGLKRAFTLMAIRTSLPNDASQIIKELKLHYNELKNEFNNFFPLIIEEVNKEKRVIIQKL